MDSSKVTSLRSNDHSDSHKMVHVVRLVEGPSLRQDNDLSWICRAVEAIISASF